MHHRRFLATDSDRKRIKKQNPVYFTTPHKAYKISFRKQCVNAPNQPNTHPNSRKGCSDQNVPTTDVCSERALSASLSRTHALERHKRSRRTTDIQRGDPPCHLLMLRYHIPSEQYRQPPKAPAPSRSAFTTQRDSACVPASLLIQTIHLNNSNSCSSVPV